MQGVFYVFLAAWSLLGLLLIFSNVPLNTLALAQIIIILFLALYLYNNTIHYSINGFYIDLAKNL
ncbi:MAG TPA: hypothetical protein DDX02_03705 [Clostridiaceae bacterium]|nr:hypothetical protein [Clostridiaceae bacterium]